MLFERREQIKLIFTTQYCTLDSIHREIQPNLNLIQVKTRLFVLQMHTNRGLGI